MQSNPESNKMPKTEPQPPQFKVGEFITIKGVLFKINQIKKNKKITLKACSQKEVNRINEIIYQNSLIEKEK